VVWNRISSDRIFRGRERVLILCETSFAAIVLLIIVSREILLFSVSFSLMVISVVGAVIELQCTGGDSD
jgi:hypothetical protein